MAPQKTGKRAAKAAAGPPAKRQKDLMLEAVEEALKMAELPSSCLAMLTAAAPHCITIPAEQRQDAHRMVVGMIDEEVEGVCKRLAAAHSSEEVRLAKCMASADDLRATAHAAQAAAAAAVETTRAQASAVESAAKGVTTAEEELRQKQQAQLLGGAEFEKSRAQGATFQKALDVDLAAVVEGGPQAKDHLEGLQPLLPQLSLPESLLSALPATCGKVASERGPFDAAVLEELRQGLQEKCAAFAQTVADGEPAAQARQSDVDTASAALEEAKSARQRAGEALDEARVAQEAAEKAAVAAQEAVTGHGPEVERLTASRDAAAAALKQFKDFNLSCWQMLRDKKMAAAPAAEVAPEAAPAAEKTAETHAHEATAAAMEATAPAALTKVAPLADAPVADPPVAAAGA